MRKLFPDGFNTSGLIGNQIADTQRKHREYLESAQRDMIDALEASRRANQLKAELQVERDRNLKSLAENTEQSLDQLRQITEANQLTLIAQEGQIRALTEANTSLRQLVERADADARLAKDEARQNKIQARWAMVVAVASVLIALAAWLLPV